MGRSMEQEQNKRTKIIIALKKARTSLDKIIARVEGGQSEQQCFAVLQQMLSVIGLLKNANNDILAEHLFDVFAQKVGTTLTDNDVAVLRDEIVRIMQVAQRK